MDFKKLTDTFTLSNGIKIPCVGFGTWQSTDGEECYNAVMSALKNGYRHIDTAAAYENEESVGRAVNDFIKQTNVSREEIFVTTKLWNDDHGYESTKEAINRSLVKLGLDYVDLYLIHWPNPIKFRDCWEEKNAGSWLAMEEAYSQGKLKAIGVSNFCERHINELMKTARTAPMVDQIKLCPGQTQKELVEFCKARGMVVEAYSPLGTGGIFSNDDMHELSMKYNRPISQICLRWSLQKGYLPLPKSVTEARIIENAGIFDFELSEEDCERISGLTDLDIRQARNPDDTPF